jgi:hypothetical protein
MYAFVTSVNAFGVLNLIGERKVLIRSTTLGTESTGCDWSGYTSPHIVVGRNLPGQINRFDTNDLLHGLTTSQGAQTVDVILCMQQVPGFQHRRAGV